MPKHSIITIILVCCYFISQNANCFKMSGIMKFPSYPNINNNIYNYTSQNIDIVVCNNYKHIINDKKK